jgi:hypothetical protein
MNVSLTPELEKLVTTKVESGRYLTQAIISDLYSVEEMLWLRDPSPAQSDATIFRNNSPAPKRVSVTPVTRNRTPDKTIRREDFPPREGRSILVCGRLPSAAFDGYSA